MNDLTSHFFEVNVDAYKGPFDLLLALIQRHELDICDIPIANIAKDFLTHVKNMQVKNMESISSFLIVAATLLRLKANALFPKEEDDEDLDADGIGEGLTGDELIASLIEYKMYRGAALALGDRIEAERYFFERDAGLEFIELKPNFLKGITPRDLANAYIELLLDANPVVDMSHLVGTEYSIEQKIDYVIKYFSMRKEPSSFSQLVSICKNKMERIVTFLALLELHRVGAVHLKQSMNFGDIEVRPGNLNYVESLN